MQRKEHVGIAIDGPSGAGKSTLAKALAAELGFLYVDTGAIYRTIGYYAHTRGIDPKNEAAMAAALPDIRIEIRYGADGLQRMLLNGQDVTAEIRLPQISLCASAVSAHPSVRAFLLERQRELARGHDVVMDGRDIGTVVLPDADLKIFLTADPEVRAGRRCLELEQRGTPQSFDQVLAEIHRRDFDDIHRAAAPLRRAGDAVELNTTELDFAHSLDALLALAREVTGR